ncbi:DEKNAAC103931 [Brettanomyces naardenensis]|uniref:Pre-mRNA-splicing factor SLT11 n=1 Tax=Brettanomyces naardenensis TaxID=13370 RepID=A0A448YPL6_BRENA|nr:DEKNAAC103931 [Brettanomyces naardenensis]
MTRDRDGAQCKICTRPFTVFKWAPRKGGAFKRTVICLTCARAKNCCQSCMLDLSLGIDLNTRDHLLKMAGESEGGNIEIVHNAKNEVARIYNAEQLDRKFNREDDERGVKTDSGDRAKLLLGKIEKVVEGGKKRKRRDETRNRHDETRKNVNITKGDLLKLCKNLPFNGSLNHIPKNEQIKTFFLFGVNDETTDYSIKEYFGDLLGDRKVIESVFVNTRGKFGFVEFINREIAEMAAKKMKKDGDDKATLFVLNRVPIRVCWAGKTVTSGSDYSNIELDKIGQLVRKQMIKLAKGGEDVKKEVKKEVRKEKRRKVEYKALGDYEID